MLKQITATVSAAALGSATVLGVAAAPASAGTPSTPATPRGSVVSATHVQDLSAAQVRAALTKDQFDASQVRHGVDAYRIVYRTVDVAGRPATASGLVVVPDNHQRRLRVISYAHGTMSAANEAPSTDDNGRSDEGLALASAGYAAVEPDYLGLGVGPGAHPYMHLASEVSAQLDMLRAAHAFAGRLHREFDSRTLVTGFSQGGDAAMAFGKALQSGADRRFTLAADAPISGPYDLTGQELPAAFDGRLDPTDAAFYLAYLLTAYNRIYHLYDRASDVFAAPYDRTVAPLYDGKHSEDQIFPALPHSPRELLTPAGLRMVQHPSGRFLTALQDNETACQDWTNARIHIYAAHGDEQVTVGNAYSCQQQLADDGVTTSLIDTGDVGHLDSGRRGLADALRWFRAIATPQGR